MTVLKLGIAMFFLLFLGCSSSGEDIIDDIGEAADLAMGVPRKSINRSITGVNAFANDARFGTVADQYSEVKNTLKLNFVRVLIAWNDQIQPTPDSSINFALSDEIARSLPAGLDALVVVTGIPSWMSNPSNWVEANPRKTFVQRFLQTVAQRYQDNPQIIGYQIWNEPNADGNPDNHVLELVSNPGNYVEMLASAYSTIKDISANKLVINAATTSINQNYPQTLDYNKALVANGATQFSDKWAFHYYGKQFEKVVLSDGIAEFLNDLNKPLWITESGEQGVNGQLGYVEQVWPFLTDEISNIERIYYYQFTDSAPVEQSYGLRTLNSEFPVSDLYIYLRDT